MKASAEIIVLIRAVAIAQGKYVLYETKSQNTLRILKMSVVSIEL